MPDRELWRVAELIRGLPDEASDGWGEELLMPWLRQYPAIVAELRGFGAAGGHRVRLGGGSTALWDLYAVGRLADLLIAPYQPISDSPALPAWWSGPLASPAAWTSFREAIGAADVAGDRFHPFFHEIVAVHPADDPDEPPVVVAQHWPGALIGGMLLARAGVTVRAGANQLDPVVAARSCLYFAWWRRNRAVADLSHGWGHNSQWRTSFRRDYVVGGELHYNVDQVWQTLPNPADRDTGMSPADRLDLLRYRHSLRTDLGDDRWPYYDSHVEQRPGGTATVIA